MIQTPRLLIRPFTSGDRDTFVGWHTHPPNRQFKWDGPLNADGAKRDFDWILGSTRKRRPTYCAIEVRQTGELVGQVGLFSGDAPAEFALAYLIDEPRWGLRYATEACRALLEDARRSRPDVRILAVIPNGHVASERVAEKLGMSPAGEEVRNGMRVRRWELAPGI